MRLCRDLHVLFVGGDDLALDRDLDIWVLLHKGLDNVVSRRVLLLDVGVLHGQRQVDGLGCLWQFALGGSAPRTGHGGDETERQS